MRITVIRAAAGAMGMLAVSGIGAVAQPSNTPTRPPGTYRPSVDGRPVILVPAAKLIGAAVRGTGGAKLGEVSELVLSRKRGRAEFALIGHGGLLGIGEKATPVPFAAFTYDASKGSLELPMTEEAFKAAPQLEEKEWATLADPARTEPILSTFGVVPEQAEEVVPPEDRPGNLPRLADSEFPLLRVSEIKSRPLHGDDGREIGKVEDLVVDATSGRVALVVVKFGGVIGIGEDRVPVPWPMFDVNKEGRLYAVKLDKEELKTAPQLKDKEWAEIKNTSFASGVYRHFGRTASWLEGGTIAPRLSAYDTLCAQGLSRKVEGTVKAVEEARPMEGVREVVVLLVDEGAGPATRVHLAPRAYLEKEGLVFKAGQTVKVEGRGVEIDGKRGVVAMTVTPAEGQPVPLRRPDGTCLWTW